MIVAVQQQFGALCGKHAAQRRGIGQTAEKAAQRALRRMMDQHDAKVSAGLIERVCEPGKLPVAEAAGRQERRRRQSGRERDQRNVAAPPHERKAVEPVVAAHVIGPVRGRHRLGAADIDVVVAGHHRDVSGVAERLQPAARARVFVGQRQIDQIAGDRDVVDAEGFQIAPDRLEDFGAMDVFALALPIDEAEAALVDELRKPRPRGEMQVGQLGEYEHCGMLEAKESPVSIADAA